VACANAGERREAFEAWALGIDEDRIEMIERPEGVVAPGVGLLPEIEDLPHSTHLLTGLNAEANGMCVIVSSSGADATDAPSCEP
jgi:hypothetical protein